MFYLLLGTLLVGAGLAVRGLLFNFFDIREAETAYFYALLACATGNMEQCSCRYSAARSEWTNPMR